MTVGAVLQYGIKALPSALRWLGGSAEWAAMVSTVDDSDAYIIRGPVTIGSAMRMSFPIFDWTRMKKESPPLPSASPENPDPFGLGAAAALAMLINEYLTFKKEGSRGEWMHPDEAVRLRRQFREMLMPLNDRALEILTQSSDWLAAAVAREIQAERVWRSKWQMQPLIEANPVATQTRHPIIRNETKSDASFDKEGEKARGKGAASSKDRRAWLQATRRSLAGLTIATHDDGALADRHRLYEVINEALSEAGEMSGEEWHAIVDGVVDDWHGLILHVVARRDEGGRPVAPLDGVLSATEAMATTNITVLARDAEFVPTHVHRPPYWMVQWMEAKSVEVGGQWVSMVTWRGANGQVFTERDNPDYYAEIGTPQASQMEQDRRAELRESVRLLMITTYLRRHWSAMSTLLVRHDLLQSTLVVGTERFLIPLLKVEGIRFIPIATDTASRHRRSFRGNGSIVEKVTPLVESHPDLLTKAAEEFSTFDSIVREALPSLAPTQRSDVVLRDGWEDIYKVFRDEILAPTP